jgi:N4-gp56 family major capsid protein
MAQTIIGAGDPKAIKKQSVALSVQVIKEAFFGSNAMIGRGSDTPNFIQRQDDLQKEAGDELSVDLLMPSKQEPTIGDDILSGNEESMVYYTDKVKITQIRHGISIGSAMSQKRTVWDLRKHGNRLLKDYWARLFDEMIFITASGLVPVNNGFVWRQTSKFWTETQPVTSPDSAHQFYGGSATSLGTITAADKFSVSDVERILARAEMMGGDATDELSMVPARIGGDEHYCIVMSPYQARDMRTSTNPGGWLDIQKAAAAAEGQKGPIFKGGATLGMINNVILKKHRNVIRQQGGAGNALPCARALFMARQAVLLAYGDSGSKLPFKITEEEKDHGDKFAIGSKAIMGAKKSRYETPSGFRDFGVSAIDTYASPT